MRTAIKRYAKYAIISVAVIAIVSLPIIVINNIVSLHGVHIGSTREEVIQILGIPTDCTSQTGDGTFGYRKFISGAWHTSYKSRVSRNVLVTVDINGNVSSIVVDVNFYGYTFSYRY